jgi:hypothetical protein
MWYLIGFVLFCETYETCILDKGLVTHEIDIISYLLSFVINGE